MLIVTNPSFVGRIGVSTAIARLQSELAAQQTRLRELKHTQKISAAKKDSFDLAKELNELDANASWATGELTKLKASLSALGGKDVSAEFPVAPELSVGTSLHP